MKKSVWAAIVLAFGILSTAFAAESDMFKISNYSIKIGDSAAEFHSPVYLLNDSKIYVSLRDICDALNIPIAWDGEKGEASLNTGSEKVNVSDKTAFKEGGVIPDKETALIVGKAILEKYADSPMEYETDDRVYYLEASEQGEKWIVRGTYKYKDENRGWSAGDSFSYPTVILSRQTGEVLYINTYASFAAEEK